MSFEGMNVDQLQALAKQIDADAQALHNLVTGLTGAVGALSLCWQGPMVARFEQDWQSRNRPALLAAYHTLTDLHAHLVSNISQQVSASAAEGGWTADMLGVGAAVLGGIEKAWEFNAKWGAPIEGPHDFLKDVGGKEYQFGTKAYKEYGKVWSKLIELDHNSPFLKYHESPAFRYVHDAVHDVSSSVHDSSLARDLRDSAVAEKAGKFLVDTHLDAFLGPAGLILAGTDAVVNIGQAGVDIKDHRYGSAIQHVGSVVQDAGPVGFLAGGAIKLLADDYQVGSQIQWSQGLPNPLSGDNFMTDYLPSIAEAPLKTLGVVKDAFL